MTDRAALFASVLADDTARLVLADWLDEHGKGDRARFLRAGVVASRFRDEPVIDDPAYYRALADLEFQDGEGTIIARMTDYECVIDASLNQAFRAAVTSASHPES